MAGALRLTLPTGRLERTKAIDAPPVKSTRYIGRTGVGTEVRLGRCFTRFGGQTRGARRHGMREGE